MIFFFFVSFVKEYINNDSLLDVVQHHPKLYSTIFNIIQSMSNYKILHSFYLDNCDSKTVKNKNIYDILSNMYVLNLYI